MALPARLPVALPLPPRAAVPVKEAEGQAEREARGARGEVVGEGVAVVLVGDFQALDLYHTLEHLQCELRYLLSLSAQV